MALATISGESFGFNWPSSWGTSGTLKVISDRTFTFNNQTYPAGRLGDPLNDNWCVQSAITVVSNVGTFASIVLPQTDTGITILNGSGSPTFTGIIYDAFGTKRQVLFQNWRVDSSLTTSFSFESWAVSNAAVGLVNPPPVYLNSIGVDNAITAKFGSVPRLIINPVPSFDLAGSALAVGELIALESPVVVPTGKVYHGIRQSKSDGDYTTFILQGTGNAAGSATYAKIDATSGASSYYYGHVSSIVNDGPGTVRGLYGRAESGVGSTGNIFGGAFAVRANATTGIAYILQLNGTTNTDGVTWIISDNYPTPAVLNDGIIFDPTISITAGGAMLKGFQTVGQTGWFLSYQSQAGAPLFSVDSSGNAFIRASPAATLDSSSISDLLHMQGGDDKNAQLTIDSYNRRVRWVARAAGGTAASPTALAASSSITTISGRGYQTTVTPGFGNDVATIDIVADSNFTDTSQATLIRFQVTPTGSVTPAEALRIDQSGSTIFKGNNPPDITRLASLTNAAIYIKSSKLVIAYNNSGTLNYLSASLDGATTTWANSAVAP